MHSIVELGYLYILLDNTKKCPWFLSLTKFTFYFLFYLNQKMLFSFKGWKVPAYIVNKIKFSLFLSCKEFLAIPKNHHVFIHQTLPRPVAGGITSVIEL